MLENIELGMYDFEGYVELRRRHPSAQNIVTILAILHFFFFFEFRHLN